MEVYECLLEGEKNMSQLMESITNEQLRSDIPAFRRGDTVRVHARVVEGTRERIQLFEGVVIKRREPNQRNLYCS